MRAAYPSRCVLCDQSIAKGDEIVPRRDGYIHKACAPGQDDQ